VLAGDLEAREALFRRHYPRILRLAYRLLGREDEAEDLAQDVAIEALHGLHRLRDGQAFDAWVGRICVFRARSRIRHYRMLRRLRLVNDRFIDPDRVVSASARPDVREELRRVYAHLQQMPPDMRIAIVLRRVEGLTLPEIADRMGRSLTTVKRRLTEAEACLNELGGDEAVR
jgi:RNA polymerase sigma-70 factor (ECF subfamily)